MQTTRAIVLRIIRYADNRVIISFFTEHYGLLSAVVRVKHGRNAGCPAALMQLLGELEFCVDFKASADLQKISNISVATPWIDMPYNPIKVSMSIFLADFLYHTLRNEGENAALFSFLEKSLRWFDESEHGFVNFHLILILRLTRFLGIWPTLEGRSRDKIYDLKSACYSFHLPDHGQYLDAEVARWIPVLLHTDYSNMYRLRLDRSKRWHMLDILLRYYRLHVPAFGELQSMDVLRELFS